MNFVIVSVVAVTVALVIVIGLMVVTTRAIEATTDTEDPNSITAMVKPSMG